MSSETTPTEVVEADQAPTLATGRVLHRLMQDGSGQDYFVYRPDEVGPDAPIFVAVHDISRNAEEQATLFSGLCERYGAMLVAPHFALDRHPNYQRLGRRRHSRMREQRADATLDAIVEEVASLTGVPTPRFHLFGYAAGARFAMRYAMAHPDRVAGVVLASAGTYTLPDGEKRFPRGIAPGPGSADLRFDPERFLQVPFTVFEPKPGRTSANPRSLRGVGRSSRSALDRNGRNWVAAMTEAADRRGFESLVCYTELDGPAHSLKALVEQDHAAERVFEALLGPPPGESAAFEGAPSGEGEDRAGAGLFPERLRRILLVSLAAGVGVALLAPVLLWAHYRSTHVVSRDAVVRGHIAEVGSRLDGVVKTVEVDTGDRVQAGQVIARLEDRHFEARVQQASSMLEKASRELEVERMAIANERLRLSSRLREVSAGSAAAGAELRAAQSRAEEASRRMQLQRTLGTQGLVSEEQVRAAETEYRTTSALVAAARADQSAAVAAQQLSEVESDGLAVRQKRVSVLESDIAAYRAELAVAQANLDGAVVRAPADGAVVRRIIEPGGATVVGQPIISLWVGEETWVEAWIDEAALADLEVGSEATVTFDSYPDLEFEGFVETIGVSTDFELPDSEVPQPRRERMRDAPLIGVRIRLVDPQEDLFPGLSAIVGIRKKDR